MPGQREDRHLRHRTRRLSTDRCTGSLYFGEPKPGDQYRVFMIAAGFGIHAKLVASVHPDPQTGRS